MLDNVEVNIDNAALNMEGAAGELRIASQHQKSRRKMCFWLMIILAVITLVVVIIFV